VSDDDIDARLEDPGYTPGSKAVARLLALIAPGDGPLAKKAAAAIGRIQSPVAARIGRSLEGRPPSERRALIAVLAQRVGKGEDEAILDLCEGALADEAGAVRGAAARVLGKVRGDRAAALLAHASDTSSDANERARLLAQLGKVGGEIARGRLSAEGAGDPRVEKARLIAQRTALRAEPSELLVDRPFDRPIPRVLLFRLGLEAIVRDELLARTAGVVDRATLTVAPGRIGFSSRAPLRAFAGLRTVLDQGISLRAPIAPGEDEIDASVRLLVEDAAPIMRSLTRGPVRYRLSFEDAGKRRAAVWKIATEVQSRDPSMVNDPTSSSFAVVVLARDGFVEIDVVPRVPDQRFEYRSADVPAASHPTLAAALARAGGVFDRDVVWDPFTGSGLELCERSLAGPYERLIGTDVDARALRVAEENLRAAGAQRVSLFARDAREERVEGLTLVITNPPMGRRVLADTDLRGLMANVVGRAASMLAPRGRIVLLSPHPRTTELAAERAGLFGVIDQKVDMGGFDAVLQRFDRPRR